MSTDAGEGMGAMPADRTDGAARPAPRTRRFGPVNGLGVASLVRRELMREWRFFGVAVLGPALQASLFAAVFTLAAGERIVTVDGLPFFQFLAPGLVIAAVMLRAFESTAYTLMFDKLEAAIQDLLGAPMTPAEILAGWIAAAAVISVGVGFTVAAAMAIFGMAPPEHPLALVWFVAAALLLFASAGVIAAILSAKWDGLSAKETFVLIPLIFLSGTFFPVSAVPEGAWRTAFQLNPIYYLVDGFRFAMTGRAGADPWTGAAVSAGAAVAVFAVALALFRSGYRIKP